LFFWTSFSKYAPQTTTVSVKTSRFMPSVTAISAAYTALSIISNESEISNL